jgi:hypothetical protein
MAAERPLFRRQIRENTGQRPDDSRRPDGAALEILNSMPGKTTGIVGACEAALPRQYLYGNEPA